jgi:hypothetical protein
MSQSLISHLFQNYNQEVEYIRAEVHAHEQFLDRQQIEEEESAEENERAYREQMRRALRKQTVEETTSDLTNEFYERFGGAC